jgi:esterase/lipase superfamily enzyme
MGLAMAAPRPPDETGNHKVVTVFYATDRNRLAYTPLAYGGEREPTKRLHLGSIDVSVPRNHQVGNVERPSIWTFRREDPEKHFVILNATEQGYDEFYSQLRGVVGRSPRKEALVFIHGFNVAFDSAVYRTAQIAADLEFNGAPILYSWPSLGTATGYPVDANNSEWTIDHLHWFLEDVAAKSGASVIHVIAHSRGNWPLMNALRTIATEPRNHPQPRFSQIVLTAPDVDADQFRLLARAFTAIAERTTLYASARDEALIISRRYQGYQRAGDVTPEIVTVNGVDSIDVSDISTSFLGHSYYGDNDSVVSDIQRLLSTGWGPDRRCGLRATTNATARYWTFVAHTICPVAGNQ